ncbi:rhomboid family intramembrane serine protease [Streptomyces sp. NPDC058374]|uniref:rhomboid family intramembrane serine protease n=1 Tax=unclassified Streptomyces TaxID=2593676 RepID=UPI0036474640
MDQGPSGAQGARDAHSLPGCYRHPERETGISCVRCERPICPECMVSASVGFQCPDCVRGGSGTGSSPVNAPRTIAGGTIAADPRLITKILLGLNAAVFVAILAMGDEFVMHLVLVGAFPPPGSGWEPAMGVAAGEWYRLVTSMFAHQEFWHFGFNMLGLWWLGGPLESALGRVRFLALYLISGLAGSALTYVIAAPGQPSLGASGAIFGLMGATAILMRRLNYDLRPVLILLGLNLAFTLYARGSIAWEAHVGGLVAGVIIGYGMVHAPRGRRALVQWGTCGAVLVAVLVMIVARSMALS